MATTLFVNEPLNFGSPDTVLQDAMLLSTLHPLAKLDSYVVAGRVEGQFLRFRSLGVENVTWDHPIVVHVEGPTEKENVLGLDLL